MTPHEFVERNLSTEPYEMARYNITKDWDYLSHPKCENLPEYLLEKARKDLQLFADREQKRLKKSTPLLGDAIIRKDGRKTFIAIFTYDGNFQDSSGGSFYLGENYMDYSGGFTMDVLNVKNLAPTNELTDLRCWLFSGRYCAGNYGVDHQIKVKVWKEI